MDDTIAEASSPPARRLPRLGFREAGARDPDSASSFLLAVLLTAALLAGAGLSVGTALRWDSASALAPTHGHESEQLVFVATPDAPSREDDPAERPVPAASNWSAERPDARPPRPPAAMPPRDTVGGDTAGQPSSISPRAFPLGPTPRGALPSPARLGEAIGAAGARSAGSRCAAPCRAAAVAGAAPGTELARRDSIIQSKMQDAVDRAGPPQRPAGFQVGLPGGGPTKEERQRDSTLHAEYRKRLELLLQRYDSARADSIARGLIKPALP